MKTNPLTNLVQPGRITAPAAPALKTPASLAPENFQNLESSVTLSGTPPATPQVQHQPTEVAVAQTPPAPPAAQDTGVDILTPGGTQILSQSLNAPLLMLDQAPLAESKTAQPTLETYLQGLAAKPTPLQGLIQAFLDKPEVAQAAKDGTAGRNLGLLMDSLSGHLGTHLGIQQGNVFTAGDTEGRERNDFETLKEQGVVVKSADGKVRFKDESSSFLFMGDLGDRGPAALKTAYEMLALKESAPDRVGFIWGNRDLGKLAIHNDLPALRDLSGHSGNLYSQWLSSKNQPNTEANQVQYWLESHTAPHALEFHRQGLEERKGEPVNLDQAAKDYVQSWRPGGVFFEFLKAGSFAAPAELMGDTHMAFHGGAARENITSIPGEANLPADLNGVIKGQFDLGKRLIAEAEADLNAGGKVKSMLLSLGDSNWMASAGINAARPESFIYSERNTQDGNLRGHEIEVAQAMQKVGKQTELVGHTPIGPVPEMRLSPEGTAKIYTDTSMANDGSQAMVARKGDLTISMSRVGDKENGQVVFFAHQPGADTQFGKITSDGYSVVGMTLEGKFFLSKYEPGYKLAQKTVDSDQLQTLNPQAQRPENSDARVTTQQKISAAIEEKMSAWGTPLMNFDSLDSVRGDRTPVVISAASAYGRHPASQEQLLAMGQSLKETFGGSIMVIDGGTSVRSKDGEKAPELIVQETLFPANQLSGAHDAKRVAAMPSVPNLDEVSLKPDAVVVTGGPEDWHLPVIEANKYAGSKGGASVFIGGGGAVAKAIEAARSQPDTPVFLVAGRGPDPMGASDKVAREANLPAHFHVIHTDELEDLGPRIQAVTGASQVADAPPTQEAPERVGVFITSANPPHKAHRALVEAIKEKHNLDKVVVCADTSGSYKKLAPLELRDQMLGELFEGASGIEFYSSQMAANGKVSSGEMWDVLEGVRATYPGSQLFNICGNDTLDWVRTLPEEKRGGDVTFLVNDRDGKDIPSQIGEQKVERFRDDSAVAPGMSSTKMRQMIAAGEQPDMLPAGVWAVIQKNGLYQA